MHQQCRTLQDWMREYKGMYVNAKALWLVAVNAARDG